MMKKKQFNYFTLLCMLIFFSNIMFANNVTVSNVSLTGQNTMAKYTHVKFDIAWENSWRTSSGPSNWDACWVFVKFRKKTETTWHHATLSSTSGNHTSPANSTINASSDGKGIFIYHSSDMASGNVNYTGAELRWDYGVDGLVADDLVEVAVFAIEMVYVPQGSFYVGDGTNTNIRGHFRQQASNTPFQITSEAQLTLGGNEASSLNNNNEISDDFDDATSQTLPANFPKGFNGFYCMKYEITQEQYVAFLNTLTRAQQNTRTDTDLSAGTISVTNRYVMSNNSTMQKRNSIRCDATIHTSNPITFYCDFNGNNTPNEAGDGQNIACNYLSWADLAAYLDWAALRPMTELEFEKACRGNQAAVANEYAWGSSSLTQASGISNAGANNEASSNIGANATYGSHASVQGPIRVGSFGQGINTRVGVGASYWGIMELSGNIGERPITLGNAAGRAFTGTNGNGAIDATGNADAINWPSTNALGTGFRGGRYTNVAAYLRVSDRDFATYLDTARGYSYGGRGVRVFLMP